MDSVILAILATCPVKGALAAHACQEPSLCAPVAGVRAALWVRLLRKQVLQPAWLALQANMKRGVSFVPFALLAPCQLLVVAPALAAGQAIMP